VKSYDTEWATAMAVAHLRKPNGVVVDFQNGINDERVAGVAGRERTLGCVITISAGMYEAGHAIRTDTGSVGFKIGEHDGRDTPRSREIARIMNDVAPTKVTTNLWGERWSARRQLHGQSHLRPLRLQARQARAMTCRGACLAAAEVIQVGRARVRGRVHLQHRRPALSPPRGQGLAAEADMARDAKPGGRTPLHARTMKGRRRDQLSERYVSSRGKQVGVKTPINDKIVELVNAPGVGLLKPDRKNLDPLWALVPH
jgi:2-dehydropantoate 2-reductase